ncbi:alpha-L-fucosidase [Adhaeretor mobilis]|uniref:alpha-L-fucosidase n=1 Tax=Adhaeretor mobilis TaxID=1930276 RepID=A0A517MTJ0_9BACT|nr:alpha-L-fucosidase [Adhaeretor mobilis]QDS98196.1 Alpha-L-fucosidase [Adhaeretor mobilis]
MEKLQQTTLILVCVALFSLVSCCSAQAQTSTSPEREERMEWWREARFGMFVHWGLYSGLAGTWENKPVGEEGGMEWLQFRVRADTDTYAERAMPLFKPTPGFAQSWAKLAKQAGCRYLVFTTKHHDGFALHDSAVTEFDAGSVLNRDLVREIVDACRAEGLRVGFYHSVIDWHHDQYCYLESKQLPHPGNSKPYPNGERDHGRYVEYLHEQVDELVSNYGPVDILWWDYSGVDFQGDEAWRAFDLMANVRDKQPQVIMNNRLFRIPEAGWKGQGMQASIPQLDSQYGDFITPEQHVPENGLPGVDWETCMTMNTTWGYSRYDAQWKSPEKLIRTLIDIASKGGNYLLNIGPLGDGSVPAESVERLAAMGRWMDVNGESIYGSTASPIGKPSWGCVTQNTKTNSLYLHVFNWPSDGKLTVEGIPGAVAKATLLSNSVEIPASQSGADVVLELPKAAPDAIATVIRLQLDGSAD